MNKKSIFWDSRFSPLFWTQFNGAMNDNIFKNALVILITFHSMSILSLKVEQMVALCGGIFILPFFLFSSLSGEITDKISMTVLAQITKWLELFIMLIALLGFYMNNLYFLLTCLFLLGFQSTLFGPVKYSIIPELLNEDELVEGNALVEMGTFLAILVGTILGGVLISKENGPYIVCGVCIVVALIGLFNSYKLKYIAPIAPDKKINPNILSSTFEIIGIAKKTRSIFISILGISWFWYFGATLLSLFPHYVRDYMHGNENVVTLFLGIFSIGVAIGSIICEKLSHERLELGLVPFGSIGLSIFILDLYFIGEIPSQKVLGISEFLSNPKSWRVIFDLGLLSIMSGFFIVPLYTFIQTRATREDRSRTVAANNIMNALFMVVSALALTVLFALNLNIPQIFLVLFVLNTLVALYIYTVIPEFLLRFCCYIASRMIYRIKISGQENIPKEGAAVITCNHITFIDWLILAGSIKRPMRFVMHYSFMKIPLFKFILKDAKVIPIAGTRENVQIMEEAFVKIKEALDEGELLCIFPEGKITYDGELNTFRPGIERIIDASRVPVIPIVMKGLWGSFFSRKFGAAGTKVTVIPKTIWMKINIIIGKEVHAKDVTAKNLEEITRNMLN
jgi:1-acyl-sn-glycerol-3-phosphate acyltransferase